MKFCLFDACFLIIRKRIKCSHSLPLTPYNHHYQRKSCQHQSMLSFKQLKYAYDCDTAVLNRIISNSDEVNVQFSTSAVPWIPFQDLFNGFTQLLQYIL